MGCYLGSIVVRALDVQAEVVRMSGKSSAHTN